MALTKGKKQEILADLAERLSKTASAVFVGFTGLTVVEASELRSALKESGVRYAVVKKTLLAKALSEKGYAGEMPELPGEVALAHLSAEASAEADADVTAPARGLQAFAKKFKDKLTFLGGVLDGRFVSRAEAEELAAIPAQPVLRGMFVNVINSPIQRLVIALDQIAATKA